MNHFYIAKNFLWTTFLLQTVWV